MVVYSCHCLNVRIFAEKPEEKPKSDALATCPLAPSCECVELVDQGFQFGFKCLIHRLAEGDWTIYVCVPCHLRTHAVNHKEKIVVVNTELRRGEEAVQVLKNQPDYSPVFKLFVNPSDGKQRIDDGMKPQSYETLQTQLTDLQETLTQYLKHEEDAMEKRIRDYEEEQRSQFARLKEKAQQDKNKLISVLFHNSEGDHRKNASDRSALHTHAPLSHSKSANEYSREIPNHPRKDKMRRRMRDSSPDVFAMDELEIEEEDEDEENANPSSRSDSDKPSDVNNSNVQQSGRIRPIGEPLDEAAEGTNNAPLMSTSVPISMPAQARNLRNPYQMDDDIEESAEFDDIPRHMQALSESIQERDRYIFGDRPRQRVHTGDFSQVNWH